MPRPHPLALRGEGLVHQVQILGSVPQNEERPIRSLKDYVPRPHPLALRGEGLVHQVQILGSVPQNEERPIRSLKDYVITFLSILYRFDRGSGNDIHSD